MVRQVTAGSSVLFLLLSVLLYLTVPTKRSCFSRDSIGYDRIGAHFCTTGNLCDPNNPDNAPVQTIGYHLFVGLIYKLFGHRTWPVIWIQILLTLVSCWLSFTIAQFFFGSRVAALTFFLCAVNIGFLVYPQFLLAEALVLVILLAFFERFLSFWRSHRVGVLVQAGLLGGLSIIIKPSILLFSPFAVLFLLLSFPTSNRKVSAIFMFTLSFAAPVCGYLAYNKARYGYFNLAPMTSLNMYHVFLSKVIARVHGISVHEAELRIPPFDSDNALDERGWESARKLFWQYARDYPFTCLYVWGQNVSKTLFGLFTTQLKLLLSPHIKGGDVSFFAVDGSLFSRAYQYIVMGSSSWIVTIIALLEALWSIVRYLLVLVAFWLLVRARRYTTALFFISAFFSFAIITGFDGCCRYRILFEPFLLILCAAAVIALYDWSKRKGLTLQDGVCQFGGRTNDEGVF